MRNENRASKISRLVEALTIKQTTGKSFEAKLEKLAEKHGFLFTSNDSRKSNSMYFDFGTPDWYEQFKVRVSDHFSSAYYLSDIDKNYYVEDWDNATALIKDLEKHLLDFKKKYIQYWSK